MSLTMIKIRLVRSPIGRKPTHRRTVAALGLKKIGAVVEHRASPQIIGMVRKVNYLIETEEGSA